ncbi:hypothetical protein O6P43_012515 [Quillaja saponaria]|uniref:Uncharacterized protein n=1 Tax=Quillaja saponaria TaxID=32244 RepID=A0AAD7M1V2_QUISA|nr:hypothetical protein O6P43_012515 [Quillaja saponaria]
MTTSRRVLRLDFYNETTHCFELPDEMISTDIVKASLLVKMGNDRTIKMHMVEDSSRLKKQKHSTIPF